MGLDALALSRPSNSHICCGSKLAHNRRLRNLHQHPKKQKQMQIKEKRVVKCGM